MSGRPSSSPNLPSAGEATRTDATALGSTAQAGEKYDKNVAGTADDMNHEGRSSRSGSSGGTVGTKRPRPGSSPTPVGGGDSDPSTATGGETGTSAAGGEALGGDSTPSGGMSSSKKPSLSSVGTNSSGAATPSSVASAAAAAASTKAIAAAVAAARRNSTPASGATSAAGGEESATTTAKSDPAAPSSASSASAASTKANKGLRHFSMKVCKKVEEKGLTTYNEVADELVKEFIAARKQEEEEAGGAGAVPEATGGKKGSKKSPKTAGGGGNYDEKNIRRRVYDALNVLMAMDIISKEKKEIRWKGLPSNTHHDLEMLERERAHRVSEVERKRDCLQELLVQAVCFRNLVRRNRDREARGMTSSTVPGASRRPPSSGPASSVPGTSSDEKQERTELGKSGTGGSDNARQTPSANRPKDSDVEKDKTPRRSVTKSIEEVAKESTPSRGASSMSADGATDDEKIPLPFIVVNTSSQAVIQCEMCPDRTDVMFDFSMPFEINDDNEILKRLGLNKTTYDDLQRMLPRDLLAYCQEHRLLDAIIVPSGPYGPPGHGPPGHHPYRGHPPPPPPPSSHHPHYPYYPHGPPPPGSGHAGQPPPGTGHPGGSAGSHQQNSSSSHHPDGHNMPQATQSRHPGQTMMHRSQGHGSSYHGPPPDGPPPSFHPPQTRGPTPPHGYGHSHGPYPPHVPPPYHHHAHPHNPALPRGPPPSHNPHQHPRVGGEMNKGGHSAGPPPPSAMPPPRHQHHHHHPVPPHPLHRQPSYPPHSSSTSYPPMRGEPPPSVVAPSAAVQ